MYSKLKDTPIIVLCGGLGTRLRSTLPDKPKVLAPIGEKTLFDFIIAMLTKAGFEKIILSVGYLKEHIKEHALKNQYLVIFSEEEEPLGTGGAVKAALPFVGTKQFFVMNGDTVFNPNFEKLYVFHEEKDGIMSMALTTRYVGSGGNIVSLAEDGRVIGWREKTAEDTSEQFDLNAGTYLMEPSVADYFPQKKKFSLENDLFPILFEQECYAFPTQEIFIDIGVPERYEIALKMFKNDASLSPKLKMW